MIKKTIKNKGFTPLEKAADFNRRSLPYGLNPLLSQILKQRKPLTGFTLAELLMAVLVMSIILAAVATLSFTLGSANDSADNTSDVYSKVRYATMYLGELVKNSKLVCANSGSSVAIWRADYNGNSQIDPNEIVYIEYDGSNNCLKLISFNPTGAVASFPRTLDLIGNGQARTWLQANCRKEDPNLIDNCSGVKFETVPAPPRTERLNIFFTISQHKYQITAQLRCYAGYLLNDANEINPNDDDAQS